MGHHTAQTPVDSSNRKISKETPACASSQSPSLTSLPLAWKRPHYLPTFKFTLGLTRWLSRYRSLRPSVKTQVQPAEPVRTDALELSSGLRCLFVCLHYRVFLLHYMIYFPSCMFACMRSWRVHQFGQPGQAASPRDPPVSVPAQLWVWRCLPPGPDMYMGPGDPGSGSPVSSLPLHSVSWLSLSLPALCLQPRVFWSSPPCPSS